METNNQEGKNLKGKSKLEELMLPVVRLEKFSLYPNEVLLNQDIPLDRNSIKFKCAKYVFSQLPECLPLTKNRLIKRLPYYLPEYLQDDKTGYSKLKIYTTLAICNAKTKRGKFYFDSFEEGWKSLNEKRKYYQANLEEVLKALFNGDILKGEIGVEDIESSESLCSLIYSINKTKPKISQDHKEDNMFETVEKLRSGRGFW